MRTKLRTTSPEDIISDVHANFYRGLYTKFLAILSEAQKHRGEKQTWIEVDEDSNERGPTLEWILYERQVMFDAVNKERTDRKLLPITMKQLRRAEDCATGHCDYSSKFALYAAELVGVA